MLWLNPPELTYAQLGVKDPSVLCSEWVCQWLAGPVIGDGVLRQPSPPPPSEAPSTPPVVVLPPRLPLLRVGLLLVEPEVPTGEETAKKPPTPPTPPTR